jgi:hypothetical protein
VWPAGALSDPDKEISTIRLFRRERLREMPKSGRGLRDEAAGSPAAGPGTASNSDTHVGSAGPSHLCQALSAWNSSLPKLRLLPLTPK